MSQNDDLINRRAAIEAMSESLKRVFPEHRQIAEKCLNALPSAQPDTARRIVGKSRGGITLWYQCDICNEPVDAQDDFCRRCGRRLTDG